MKYKAEQKIEVEIYDHVKRKSVWTPGIFKKKVQATDMPFRYEVEVNGRLFEGFGAVHPDCVRPVKQ